MTGNPYHDATGKFCSKDASIESYESEIEAALIVGDTDKAESLKKEYESMMINANPQSDVAQKALQRDYGMVAKIRSKVKLSRKEKNQQKQLLASDRNTQKAIEKFDKRFKEMKAAGYSDEDAIKVLKSRNFDYNLIQNRALYHPDLVVKPVGKFKEVPLSETQEGDIITVSMYPSASSGPMNYTARIKKIYGNTICLHNPNTRLNRDQASYVMGNSIEDARNANHSGASIITSVIRDEGAEEFLKEHEKREMIKEEQKSKIKELERKKKEIEKEIFDSRGH